MSTVLRQCLAKLGFVLGLLIVSDTSHALIITEIYSETPSGSNLNGCGKTFSSSDRFVEIYNEDSVPVEIANLKVEISDGMGSSSDSLVLWNSNFHGPLNGITILNDSAIPSASSVLPPNTYAVILDPDYGVCDQSLNSFFPSTTYVYTLYTGVAVPGSQGFGNTTYPFNATALVTIKDSSGTSTITTYGGVPPMGQGSAFIPVDLGSDYSIERKSVSDIDKNGNWQMSAESGTITPGRINTIANGLVLNEVMSSMPSLNNNCCTAVTTPLTYTQTNEYVELFNGGSEPIDLAQFDLADEGGQESLVPWQSTLHGSLRNLNLIVGSTLLAPGGFAIVLDPDYGHFSDQLYEFPPGTLVLTISNTADGSQSIGSNGLGTTESLKILNALNESISTFGTPLSTDGFPYDLGALRSWEKINSNATADSEAEWQESTLYGTNSPGGPNSISTQTLSLAWQTMPFNPMTLSASTSGVIAAFALTSTNPIYILGFSSVESIDAFDGTLDLSLYQDNQPPINALSGSAQLKGVFQECPSRSLVRDSPLSSSQLNVGYKSWFPFLEGRALKLQANTLGTYIVEQTTSFFQGVLGLLNLSAPIPQTWTTANQSQVSCKKGSWILEGISLASGNYKLVGTLSSIPTQSKSVQLVTPSGWIRSTSNTTNQINFISNTVRIEP